MRAMTRIYGHKLTTVILADVFAIQSEIAKAIADQLQAKLSPAEKSAIEQRPTNDVAAFDLYSRAKNLMLTTAFSAIAGKKLDEAISLLNQALQRDPSFFVAQCNLARAHDQLYALGLDHTPARLATAGAAVDAAIRLRPEAGESHLVRAQHLYYGYRDYDGALKELELARQTLPNNPEILELTGYILRRRGKSEEGLQFIQRALDLDPRNFYTLQQIALSYAYQRRYAEEGAVLDRAIDVKPDDVETRATRALIALDWKADTRPLHRIIDEIRAQNPGALPNIADVWVLCAFAERDPAGLENALRALGDNSWGDNATLLSAPLGEGLLARLQHDEEKARAAFTRAREEQQKLVQADPNFAPTICILGLIDAGSWAKERSVGRGAARLRLDAGHERSVKRDGHASVWRYRSGVGWRKGSGLRASFCCRESSKRVELRTTEAVAVVGPTPRQSALRKNRQFPRTETVTATVSAAPARTFRDFHPE